MRLLLVSALMLAVGPVWAQAGRSAAVRPLSPTILERAKTAFLMSETRGPNADKQLRELRAEMRKWNHFEVLKAAKGADVVISLSEAPARSLTVRQGSTGTILWSATNGTVGVMVKRMKQQLPPGPSVCVAFWCW